MKPISVSAGELEVLRELWEDFPLSAPVLLDRVCKRKGWDESTVKTLLARLVAKEAVKQEGKKRFYQYTPLLTQEQYREQAGGLLLEQAFDSSCGALVSFFARRGKFSPEDIATLKQTLAELEAADE